MSNHVFVNYALQKHKMYCQSIFIQTRVADVGEFSNDKPGTRTALKYQGAVLDCKPPSFNPGM